MKCSTVTVVKQMTRLSTRIRKTAVVTEVMSFNQKHSQNFVEGQTGRLGDGIPPAGSRGRAHAEAHTSQRFKTVENKTEEIDDKYTNNKMLVGRVF